MAIIKTPKMLPLNCLTMRVINCFSRASGSRESVFSVHNRKAMAAFQCIRQKEREIMKYKQPKNALH